MPLTWSIEMKCGFCILPILVQKPFVKHCFKHLFSISASLGWSLKLKVGKSKLQPPEFILLVKKTLLVNFFLGLTTFTPPSSTCLASVAAPWLLVWQPRSMREGYMLSDWGNNSPGEFSWLIEWILGFGAFPLSMLRTTLREAQLPGWWGRGTCCWNLNKIHQESFLDNRMNSGGWSLK